ncbi:hypothetical protein VFPPC_18248 [Pochonia chlamydosporia 170]|uniref:Uncharacterized protein n=1 Tax=Pochonia chlamydosporia 170 TaxID=1380566 RepID=A0A219AQJ9_METCM|nr:hypothetical protein VFPPC_18248 [Pochonia chlamydosporia 170]OWT43031.1 hypothetical protein VFPPC_18248 [Pochonia chlamydosporia 170]
MASNQVPPVKTAVTARSEEECYDLLVKEISSIPDREVPVAQNGENGTESNQVAPMPHLSRGPAPGTSTNVMIAKTIRAAMAGMRPGS